MAKQYYTIYLVKTEEIVAAGSATECASAMGKTENGIYSLVSRVRSGRNKKYEIEQENYDE